MNVLLAREFEAWCFDRHGYAKTTRTLYRRRIQAFAQHLHPRSVIRATDDQLDLWIGTLPATASSRNIARQAAVAFYRFCVDTGRRKRSPADHLRPLRYPPAVPRALTVEQAAAILTSAASAGPQAYALMSVLLHTGLRCTEVRTLTWGQLADVGWVRFVGKGGQERVVPVHGDAVAALSLWSTVCPDPTWVWPSPVKDGPLSETTFRRMVRQVGEAGGVAGLHPHACRHTLATSLLEAGVDVRSIQQMLGHRSLATTQRYTDVRPVRLAEAVGALSYREPVTVGG